VQEYRAFRAIQTGLARRCLWAIETAAQERMCAVEAKPTSWIPLPAVGAVRSQHAQDCVLAALKITRRRRREIAC